MRKNNLTFGYVLFVGIPLLVLIFTLRAGGHLAASPALAGEWLVEQAPETPPPDKCAGPLANGARPTVNIYQAGADVQIAFNDPRKTTLAGRLENGRVAATGKRGAAPVNCGDQAAIRLEAAIAGKPGQRSLLGRISFDGCAACPPVQFMAARPALPAGR
jgi:hypothetical protein